VAKKHKKQHHEEHIDESWLIPYADMLTLLLALFIVLFASSTVDQTKYDLMADTFFNAFTGQASIMDYPEVVPNEESINPQNQKSGEMESGKKEGMITEEQDQRELKELQERLNQYIKEKNLSSNLETELTAGGLMLTITEGVLFQSGQAEINGQAVKIAGDISELLIADPPRYISIGGHTDNRPISTAKFPSNWELSSARAVNFMKVLLNNTNLEPSHFSATGYAEHRPIAPNDSAEGREKNRRVEVLILPYNIKE
jgi:chemotaxis protein MotB